MSQLTKKNVLDLVPDLEERREKLSNLAALGLIEEYTGEELTPNEVEKLSAVDVVKIYNSYNEEFDNKLYSVFDLIKYLLKAIIFKL